MTEDSKNQNEVTPEGTVEIREEDLDQASGGAGYLKMPTDQLIKQSDATIKYADGSVKQSGYDLKPGGYDLNTGKKI